MPKYAATALSWTARELGALRERHEERHLHPLSRGGPYVPHDGRRLLNLASNDYLGLAGDPDLAHAAAVASREWGVGATASRLVTGTLTLHEALEKEIAEFKRYPSALLFGSGYLTSLGVLPVLVGRHDVVVADRLAHACLLDAIQLSGARLRRFRHNDANHAAQLLEQRNAGQRCLLVTESVFSMDGDRAPLADLASLAAEHDAMFLVDEAHATGIFGPAGAGLTSEGGLQERVTVAMGTISKGLGGYGGFACMSPDLRDLLVNRSRPFIFSTALPPPVLAAARAAIRLLRDHPGWGAEVLHAAGRVRAQLHEAGLDTLGSSSQIIPVLIGDNERTVRIGRRLRDQGVLVGAIRPPTVPAGTARLRLSISRAHHHADLDQAVKLILEAVRAA